MLALGRRSKSRDRAGTGRHGQSSHSRERPTVPLTITVCSEDNEEEEKIQPQKTLRRGRNKKRSQSISEDALYSEKFLLEDDMLREYRKEESMDGTPKRRADTQPLGLSRSLHSPRPRSRSRSGRSRSGRSRSGRRSRSRSGHSRSGRRSRSRSGHSRSRSRPRRRSRSRSKSSTRRDRTNSCKMTKPLSFSDHSLGDYPAFEDDPAFEEHNEKTQDQLREELMQECMGAIERRQKQARQLISSDEQMRRKDFDNLLKQSIKQRVTQSNESQSTPPSSEVISPNKMRQQTVGKDERESNYSPKKRNPSKFSRSDSQRSDSSFNASSDFEVSLEDQYTGNKEETKQDSAVAPIKISKHDTHEPRSGKAKKQPVPKNHKRTSATTTTEETEETSHQLTSTTKEFHTHLHDGEPEITTKSPSMAVIFRKKMSNIIGTGRSRSKSIDKSRSTSNDHLKSRPRSNSNNRLKSRSRSNSNDRLKSRSRSNSNDTLRSRSRSTKSNDTLRSRSRSTKSNDRLKSRSRSRSNDRSKRRDRSKSRTREVRKARSWDSTTSGNFTDSKAETPDKKAYSDSSTIDDIGDMNWHNTIRKHDWESVQTMLKSYDYARYRRKSNDEGKPRDLKDGQERSPLLQVDANGRTPLHLACKEQMPSKLLRRLILLERNAASIQDADGRYPLHLAVIYNVDQYILDGVIRMNPDCLGTPDNLKHTPLQYAVLKADRSRGNKEVKWGPPGSEGGIKRQNLQIEAYEGVLFILESMIKRDKELSNHESKIALEAVKLCAPPDVVKHMVMMSEKFLRMSQKLSERLVALVFERNYPLSVLHTVLEVVYKAIPPAELLETIRTRLTIHFNEGCNGILITGPHGEKVTTSLAKEFAKSCRKGGKKVGVTKTCKDWWEKLRYLIARSCNRTSNWKNDTILHMALCNPKSQPSLIEYLCRLNPAARYKLDEVTGALPIHLAYMNWQPEQYGIGNVRSQEKVLNLLLAGDFDLVRERCARGRIPLHHAILSGKPLSCIEILLNLDQETLSVRDPVTNLLPFQLAAVPRKHEDGKLDMIFTLLTMTPC